MMFLVIRRGLKKRFQTSPHCGSMMTSVLKVGFFRFGEEFGQVVDVRLEIGEVFLVFGSGREVGVQDPLILGLRLRYVGDPRLQKLLEDPLCPHLREVVGEGLGQLGLRVELEVDPFCFFCRGFVHAAGHDASFRCFPAGIG